MARIIGSRGRIEKRGEAVLRLRLVAVNVDLLEKSGIGANGFDVMGMDMSVEDLKEMAIELIEEVEGFSSKRWGRQRLAVHLRKFPAPSVVGGKVEKKVTAKAEKLSIPDVVKIKKELATPHWHGQYVALARQFGCTINNILQIRDGLSFANVKI